MVSLLPFLGERWGEGDSAVIVRGYAVLMKLFVLSGTVDMIHLLCVWDGRGFYRIVEGVHTPNQSRV